MHPNILLAQEIAGSNKKSLARSITIVENRLADYELLLQSLQFNKPVPIIGITGPPGAGKSSLISALLKFWTAQNKKIGIIAVDPSSPFHKGSLMGDRLRMNDYFLHPNVFIRSMSSRGSLGGLSPAIFEAADVMRAYGFDYIIIETVGVGQSEVEIAGLADTTVLVLVPEAGDDIQTIKSGVMEIADIYVLNKSDRQGADAFYKNLSSLAHTNATEQWEAPVIKTVATTSGGIETLCEAIITHASMMNNSDKKAALLTDKAILLIKEMRTQDLSYDKMMHELKDLLKEKNFNLYKYVQSYKAINS
jgi:LAO/AO transport system kinase